MSQINSQDVKQMLREIIQKPELSEEELIQLAQKVIEEGSQEAKFILRLNEFKNYCHPDGVYMHEIKVLYGDVKFIQTYQHEDVCTKDYEYLVIPLSRLIIIFEEWNIEGYYFIYVFSPKTGWVSLSV